MLRSLFKLCSIGLLIWCVSVAPAHAEFCRQVDGHRICIVDIKRSAKNYWQYQAVVSNDGIPESAASYDCRERLITDVNGKVSSFRARKDAKFVCSLYRPRG
ncbi:MAG: hypothetical protein LH474_08050 [Chamaesiphon sp.]|nr:hypothetical protein [Chamaesiphon sp.]